MSLTTIVTAGDTYSQLVPLAAYPASAGWVLKARFTARSAGGAAIDITGSAEGDDHRLTVAAATTANWVAGSYSAVLWVERAGESYTVGQYQLSITPNLRTVAVGTDTRSQAQRALDDARAAFAAWRPTLRKYRILDREREFNSAAEILKVISYWEREVEREMAAANPHTTSAAATQGGRFYIRAR